MDELDELIKGMGKPAPAQDDEDEDDGYDGDGEDGDEDEDDEAPPMKKAYGSKGCYPAADNGDDDDQPSGAAVRDPEKIERKTRNLGSGKVKKPKGVNAGTDGMSKSVRDLVDSDSADVIDGAPALAAIADAVDELVGMVRKSLRRMNTRLDEVDAAQALIGTAVTKSLQGNSKILKSLQAEVEAVGAQPRGRKAVTKAVDRKFAGGDAPAAPSRMEIMTKSLKALSEGRITATESASIDSYFNRGVQLPPALLAKING
jgi:hypothetical protein